MYSIGNSLITWRTWISTILVKTAKPRRVRNKRWTGFHLYSLKNIRFWVVIISKNSKLFRLLFRTKLRRKLRWRIKVLFRVDLTNLWFKLKRVYLSLRYSLKSYLLMRKRPLLYPMRKRSVRFRKWVKMSAWLWLNRNLRWLKNSS